MRQGSGQLPGYKSPTRPDNKNRFILEHLISFLHRKHSHDLTIKITIIVHSVRGEFPLIKIYG